MPGLEPGIHVLLHDDSKKDVDGRNKAMTSVNMAALHAVLLFSQLCGAMKRDSCRAFCE
jgi:hypothetical protein